MIRVKDMTLIAILAVLLFALEQALTLLPNIQVTVMLLVLYSKMLGWKKTGIIIVIHVVLDNLVMGSFNILTVPFMLVGWLSIPILLATLFKKVDKTIHLALLGGLFSFLYSWIFMIPGALIQGKAFMEYFIADLPFEIILAASSFLTILWLYEPLSTVFIQLNKNQKPNQF